MGKLLELRPIISGIALFIALVTFRVMGSNYEAAALVAGQCGFGLGATPTAIANMQAVCERYGYAPQGFIIAPVVGALLIDIANAIVICAFAGVWCPSCAALTCSDATLIRGQADTRR